MASNRYASHLSGCIGIGTGTRRAAVRNATSKSKYGLCFGLLWRYLIILMVLCTGAGSGQMRDALSHPTQARRTGMRLITTLLSPRQDLRKRVGHQRISQKVEQMSLCCCGCQAQVVFLSASVPATSNVNDDGDVLSTRKRVCETAILHHGSPVDSSQPGSPLSSPTKIKKQKVSGTLIHSRMPVIADITFSSSCASRKREEPLNLCHSLNCANNFGQNSPLAPPGAKSQSKIPSRLRESSIALSLEIEATGASPGSRSSSPATAATPTSSALGLGNGKQNSITAGSIVDEKRIPRIPSPPRPPPPVTRRPETDYLIGKHVLLVLFVSVNDGE
jgi:hypothetical protein